MGIDEIHLIKPHCVISNIRNNTIIDMLPNRDKKTVVNYHDNLRGKSEVQYVAIDMWTPYRNAVQAVLSDGRIVIDKFHVVRMANCGGGEGQEEPARATDAEAAPGLDARPMRTFEAWTRPQRQGSPPARWLDKELSRAVSRVQAQRSGLRHR